MKFFGTADAWSAQRIIVCHAIALLIGLTMLWQPVAEAWLDVSANLFFAINGSLHWAQWWAVLWAALNTGTYDILGAVLMFLPSVWYVFFARDFDFDERLARSSIAWGGVIITVFISKKLLPEVEFYSPSLVLEPVVLLNELVPAIDAKWESKNSFPGDHAVAAFSFTGLCFLLLNRTVAWLSALFGVLYSLPRLFAGAHWLSDELVGGGIALFVALGWVSNAPALPWARSIWKRLLFFRNPQRR